MTEMSNLISVPKILGIEPIPSHRRCSDGFTREVVMKLPEVPAKNSLVIEYPNFEELKASRKSILTYSTRVYGSSRVITRSQDNVLYVWIKSSDLELSKQIREHDLSHDSEIRS